MEDGRVGRQPGSQDPLDRRGYVGRHRRDAEAARVPLDRLRVETHRRRYRRRVVVADGTQERGGGGG